MSRSHNHPRPIAIMIGQLTQGGSERQLYSFLAHCDRSRWCPAVFVSGELGYWESPIRQLGIPVTLLQGHPAAKLRQLRAACRAQKIGDFFSWSSYTNGFALALAGIPGRRIGSFRNRLFADLPERGRRLWTWFSLAGISTFVCNAPATYEALRSRVGARSTVVYVPNSVQAPPDVAGSRATWRERLGIDAHEALVVGVGRITPQKNFGRFIETIACVRRETPVRAVIAGEDFGCRAALEQQAAATGLAPDSLRFIGPVPDARELICAADVVLLTSDFEGTPNVLLEAMAAGVASVATVGSNAASVLESGQEGLVAEPRVETLAAAVALLARDAGLRARIGAAAAARVRRQFAPQPIAQRLWALCEA